MSKRKMNLDRLIIKLYNIVTIIWLIVLSLCFTGVGSAISDGNYETVLTLLKAIENTNTGYVVIMLLYFTSRWVLKRNKKRR